MQRRLPASWLKGGEKPDYSGRERSRSVCKERRRRGKKLILLPHRNTTAAGRYTTYDNMRPVQAEP